MGSDAPAPSTAESTASMIEAYRTGLPGLMNTVNSQISGNELAQLKSAMETSPAYSKLQADIYDTVGRRLSQTGSDIAGQQQLSSAQNDLNTMRTTGRDLLNQSVDMARIADPEYYANRALLGGRLTEALNAGPNLSEGEMSQIERGINRSNAGSGNNNNASATNVAAGAATYGRAGVDKINNAIQMATNALPSLRSGLDANLISTGKISTPNAGDNKFIGARQGAGDQVSSYGNNLLGQIGDTQRTAMNIDSNRRTGLEKSLGFATNMLGSAGSFFKK